MTFKCPFKDQLAALDKVDGDEEVAAAGGAPSGSKPGLGAGGGKYLPPYVIWPSDDQLGGILINRSMRGAGGAGESMFKRDDFPTLRIQSLSTDADEEDLKLLFGSFGRIVRANVIRDRETQESKGFGFVSYESRKDAEKALAKMNGHGTSWAIPFPERTLIIIQVTIRSFSMLRGLVSDIALLLPPDESVTDLAEPREPRPA